MLKPEQVPTQVIEAFRVALKNDDTTFAEDFCIALNAWPGAFWHEFRGALDGTGIVLPVAHRLPLTEASDGQ